MLTYPCFREGRDLHVEKAGDGTSACCSDGLEGALGSMAVGLFLVIRS